MTKPRQVVAGLGYRAMVTGADIVTVVRNAMRTHGVRSISGLAVPGFKPADDTAVHEAAAMLGLALIPIGESALSQAAPHCVSTMKRSAPSVGTKSVAEACAIAAAGEGGALLGPRVLGKTASCALARVGS